MNVTLKDHQEKCKQFILQHPKCGVFLDIGYGKTLTTLQAIYELDPRNVLIVAPKAIARTTWHSEVKKWNYPFKVYSMVEDQKDKEIPLKKLIPLYEILPKLPNKKGESNLFVTSRDRVKHLADWCEKNNIWPFDMIVCDEFQSFKGGRSQRTEAITKLANHTRRVIGLTGTPMPNSLEDIWSEIKILDGGTRLGKYITHFREKYEYSTMVVNGHSVGWKPRPNAEKELFAKISDITISVKTDLHLPSLTINDIKVQLSKEDLDKYNRMARAGCFDLSEIDPFAQYKTSDGNTDITPANAAVLAGKLLQMASGTIYDDMHNTYVIHNQKLAMLKYIVDNTGGPVLIAYHFNCDKERILNILDPTGKDPSVVFFDGSNTMKDNWNNGMYKAMLLQPASTCHGINLQDGGNVFIWYSIPWSLEQYLQANGRLYRQGQTKPVIIHRLIAENTIDERVALALSKKEGFNEGLLEAVRREINGGNV